MSEPPLRVMLVDDHQVVANIELGLLGEDRTQLAISARYQPPLGVVGHAIDRVLLHRVAEATLKDFLDRVGQAIILSQSGERPLR